MMHGDSMGMDSQHDVVWKENFSDELTQVGYVSFGLLRQTAWWDETYNAVLFSFEAEELIDLGNACSGFVARLVPRKNGTNQTEISIDSSDKYTHKFIIEPDSKYALHIFVNQ